MIGPIMLHSYAKRWRRGTHRALCLVLAIAAMLGIGLADQRVIAQTAIGWSEPVNVSNTDVFSSSPKIAADQSGRVHLVWAETANQEEAGAPDATYYTSSTDDDAWSSPVDILAVSAGDSLNPYALTVDPYGRLVLVWTQNRGVNVSLADASAANNAQAWKTERLDVSAAVNSADISIDQSGVCHLVYVRNNKELVYAKSSNTCDRWSDFVTVAFLDRDDEAVLAPSIAVSADGLVYLSWTRTAESANWGPVGVAFSRSKDGGVSWETPQAIVSDGRYGYTDLLVDAEGGLHHFWLGSGDIGGRYHQLSRDQGANWMNPTVVMQPGDITGFPGASTLLRDSAGTVHVIFAGLSQVGAQIFHDTWAAGSWQSPMPISGDLPDSQGPTATLSLGNRILAAWIEYESEDIWAASYLTGSQEVRVDVLPLPETITPAPTPDVPVVPTESEAPATVHAQTTPTLTTSTAAPKTSGTMVLILALAPALLLVVVVVLYQLRRR